MSALPTTPTVASSSLEPGLTVGLQVGSVGTAPAGASLAGTKISTVEQKQATPPLQIIVGAKKPVPLYSYIRGLTLDQLVSMLEAFDRGNVRAIIPTWRKMAKRDAHLLSVIEKRLGRLAGKDWEVTPSDSSDEAKKQAIAIAEFLEAIPNFESRLADLGEALKYSIAGHEIEWLPGAGPAGELRARLWTQNPEDFDLTLDRPRLLTGVSNLIELPPDKFLVHRLPIARMEPSSIMYVMKFITWGQWMRFGERFGSPAVHGEAPAGAAQGDLDAFYDMLTGWAEEHVSVSRENYKVTLLETNGSTGTITYPTLLEWINDENSKIWTGHTLMTTAKSGSGTLAGEAAQDQLDDLTSTDGERLAGTIDEFLVEPFVRFQFNQPLLAHFTFKTAKVEDLTALAEILVQLSGLGMKFPAADAYTRFGWRMPEQGEQTIGGSPSTAPAQQPPAFDAKSGMEAFKTLVAAQVQQLADPRMAAAREAMTAMLAPLQELVDGAGNLSPDELRSKILKLDLPVEQFAAVMGPLLRDATQEGAAAVLEKAKRSLGGGGA